MMKRDTLTPFRKFDVDQTVRHLEERLNDGYELIEARQAAGRDVAELEDFWIKLLHEYEALCNEHPLAA